MIFKGSRGMRSILVFSACAVFGMASGAYAEDVYSFTVRGVVQALPGAGRAPNELLVKHEPIPDYRDSSGEVVGMAAMTMPFYLGEGVAVNDLKVNDPVELTVEQRIRPKYSEKVVRVTKR